MLEEVEEVPYLHLQVETLAWEEEERVLALVHQLLQVLMDWEAAEVEQGNILLPVVQAVQVSS
jgi:hypothetical protein